MSESAAPGGASAERPAEAAGADEPRWLRIVRLVAAPVGLVLLYYAIPLTTELSTRGIALTALGLILGVSVLAWCIVLQIRRVLEADDPDAVRLEALLILICLVVVVFSLGYLIIARETHDEFADLHTKTDALYFTMTTVATIGYGDVHATGQTARALVTLQIAFDLVFVAAVAATFSGMLRRRAEGRRARRR